MTSTTHDRATSATGPAVSSAPTGDADARDDRFSEGVRALRIGGATLRLEERVLMVLGGVIAPLGLVIVILGWWGASRTPYVFEQVPYLISGGLLGVGLVFLGSFFYFTHWITQLVKEHRVQSVAVLDALQRLHDQVAAQNHGPLASTHSNGANGSHAPASAPASTIEAVPLVATAQGTMAHRTTCAVVSGKKGLRRVSESDGLAPCKMCEPYER